MTRGFNELIAFNRGMISPLALARVDVKRLAFSAETQENWMPRKLGSMMLRPGFQYTGMTLSNNKAVHVPFIFTVSDTAILQITDTHMVPLVNEVPVTRVAVSTVITNGTFTTDLSNWTDADQSGAVSAWATGSYMGLTGTLSTAAIRKQTVTVGVGDRNKEHALRVVVNRGTVSIRVGSSDGADDYVNQIDLRPGTYSLAFTPTNNFFLQFSSLTDYQSQLTSVAIEGAGDVSLPTPWLTADLPNIRWDQSGDVVFVACDGYQQRRLVRFISTNSRSWGVDLYQPPDGPFELQNIGQTTLTPSAISGDITLTASQPLFYATMVGQLFSIDSTGQQVIGNITAADQWSDPIRVIGVGTARTITITRSGTWSGTVRIQSSVGDVGSWADVPGESWTTNGTVTYADGLDNQIVYYRIGIDVAEYTSGTAVVSLTFAAGSITGIVRVTGYTNNTTVTASVLKHLGRTTASVNWSQGAWSDRNGWPTCTALFEGRLWFGGRDNIWGSISNAYESFDDTQVGDSGPISQGLGSGPVDVVNWLLPLIRLIAGGEGAEHSIRSSSLDEPLTPTNFSIKEPSTRGSINVPAVKRDTSGFFVNQTGTRLCELNIENAVYSYDYTSIDRTEFCPEAITGTITRLAIQRTPDTRIHSVLSDGSVMVLVYDSLENVQAIVKVVTDGVVEDVFVMPNRGQPEEKVYYCIKRTIGGVAKRYLERWAMETECQGPYSTNTSLNKQADAFIIYSGVPTTVITGLSHLEGKQVVVWGDAQCFSRRDSNGVQTTFTVTGGQITIPTAVSNAIVGLSYTARFLSTKLSSNNPDGISGLTQKGRTDHMAMIMYNTYYQGLQYGTSADAIDELPLVEDDVITATDYVWPSYDHDAFEIDDIWSSDSRIYLQAMAPMPCTVLGAIVSSETSVKK